MQHLDTKRTGLALGSFVAIVHVVWAILLAIGLAKPLLDFILSVHHIQVSFSIEPFSLGKAVLLVVVTFVVGYIFGWVFATGWNKCKKH